MPEDLGDRAQGVRRGPLRDVRPGVRSRRVPRAAERADRGDGPRARGERGVLQQDPGDRGSRRAGRVRGRAAGRVRRPTSTSCTSRPSSSSTRWSQPEDLRAELITRFALGAHPYARGLPPPPRRPARLSQLVRHALVYRVRPVPLAVDGDGRRHLSRPAARTRRGRATWRRRPQREEEPLPPIPWHLKLLAVAVVIYLGFRLFQGLGWLSGSTRFTVQPPHPSDFRALWVSVLHQVGG